jgi:hypothetical protein
MSPGRTGPRSRFGRSPLTGKMITTSKLKRHGTRHDWPQSRFRINSTNFLDLFFRPLRNDNFTLMCAVVTRCEGTKTLTLKRIWCTLTVLLTLTCSNSHGQRHGRAVVVGIGNGRHIGHLRLTVRVRAGLACRGGHMKDEGGGECAH